MQHIRVVHSTKPERVSQNNFLDSVCVDKLQGLYLVQSGTPGPNIPFHVQKKVVYGCRSDIDCKKISMQSV